jgi:hypothetical protein
MTRLRKVRWPEPSSCPLHTRLARGVDLSFFFLSSCEADMPCGAPAGGGRGRAGAGGAAVGQGQGGGRGRAAAPGGALTGVDWRAAVARAAWCKNRGCGAVVVIHESRVHGCASGHRAVASGCGGLPRGGAFVQEPHVPRWPAHRPGLTTPSPVFLPAARSSLTHLPPSLTHLPHSLTQAEVSVLARLLRKRTAEWRQQHELRASMLSGPLLAAFVAACEATQQVSRGEKSCERQEETRAVDAAQCGQNGGRHAHVS